MLPRVGHLSNLEAPEGFSSALARFLSRVFDAMPFGIRCPPAWHTITRCVVLLSPTVVLAFCTRFRAGAERAAAPAASGSDPFHRPLDQILDVNVRDGLVYYRALQSSRGALDRYVASLNVSTATYDALVARSEDGVLGERVQRLRPADRRRPLSDPRHEQRLPGVEHPPDSRRVRSDEASGGRAERDARRDREDHPRRSSTSRGCRSRSAAAPSAAAGCGAKPTRRRGCRSSSSRFRPSSSTRQRLLKVDRAGGQVSTTPIVSWHEAEFVAAYGSKAGERFATRSPIERALIAFITPHVLPLERGVPRREPVQGHVPSLRLAAERSDRRADRVESRAALGSRLEALGKILECDLEGSA